MSELSQILEDTNKSQQDEIDGGTMTYVCRLTLKLASLWLPPQTAWQIFDLDFGLLQEIISVTNTSF